MSSARVALAVVLASLLQAECHFMVETGHPSRTHPVDLELPDEDLIPAGQVSLLQINFEMKHDMPAALGSASQSSDTGAKSEGEFQTPLAIRSVAVLTIQFMVVYTMWMLCKVCNERGVMQLAMDRLTALANMIPMICLLIIASHMRAEQLARLTRPSIYGIPQWWVAVAEVMLVSAGILAMLLQFFSTVTSAESSVHIPMLTSFLGACRTVVTCVQYLGVAIVIAGAVFMEEPFDLWLDIGRINITASMACLFNLTIQFFVVYMVFLLAGAGSSGRGLAKAARMGVNAQSLGPVLAIIISATRLRALDVSRANFDVQSWTQTYLYLCVDGLLVYTVLAISMEFADSRSKSRTGEETAAHRASYNFLSLLRSAAFIVVFVGIGGMISSILLLKDQRGWAFTPELSAELTVALVLAMQCFIVHIGCWLCSFCETEKEPDEPQPNRAPTIMDGMNAARETAFNCCILAAIMLAARVRVSQLSPKVTMEPEDWMQNCMYACMWGSLLHLVLVLASAMQTEARVDSQAESRVETFGSGERPKESPFLGIAQMVCLVIMYGAAISVISGIFRLTPAKLVSA
eukprot:CAMPEP_0171081084 /NCGR_PEP_ID=MMETSP0766_2-20121228/16280_1 /TAXON_ID=439317 /ORGANISM="Gambierdiscus australes, Strain CAWD 149" /LENGTH=575 /DNA_ID=CAMNT_0011538371 /DNA_START=86 /DNA_END=1813 /DNA_ORIENTATION=+